jgi:hypothetical protein
MIDSTRTNLKAPLVLHLAAHVEVQLGHKHTVPSARKALRIMKQNQLKKAPNRGARAVGGGDVARTVEVAEVSVCLFAVPRRELVRECFLRAYHKENKEAT